MYVILKGIERRGKGSREGLKKGLLRYLDQESHVRITASGRGSDVLLGVLVSNVDTHLG